MSTAPARCMYCDGTDPNCGFCDMGVPLDTQDDWDRSWGKVLDGPAITVAATTHAVTAAPVVKMDGGVIGYRFECSCGRIGNGTHRTPAKAVRAGSAHVK